MKGWLIAALLATACAHGGMRSEANKACAADLYKGHYAKTYNIAAEWCDTIDDEHIGFAKRLVDDHFVDTFPKASRSVEHATAAQVECARAEFMKQGGGTFRIPPSCR